MPTHQQTMRQAAHIIVIRRENLAPHDSAHQLNWQQKVRQTSEQFSCHTKHCLMEDWVMAKGCVQVIPLHLRTRLHGVQSSVVKEVLMSLPRIRIWVVLLNPPSRLSLCVTFVQGSALEGALAWLPKSSPPIAPAE